MKRYDGWTEPYSIRPSVRVTGRQGGYFLARRSDLFDGAERCPDAISRASGVLWELAGDLLADAVGYDDLAVMAAPDFRDYLVTMPNLHDFLLYQEDVQNWVVGWVARECGLMHTLHSEEPATDVTL